MIFHEHLDKWGFFIIYSPLLFMSPSQNQCIILYTQKKRKGRQNFRQSLIMGFDVVILSSPCFFPNNLFLHTLLPSDQTFHDSYMRFCLSLSSLYSIFFNCSWVQCTGQLKKPNLFFVTSYLFDNMVIYMTFEMNILISMDF
jgi:hypothetical protein